MSQRSQIQTVEGDFTIAEGARFAIIASRFNSFIVEHLVEGAIDALLRHGAKPEALQIIKVPGSWEIPLTCQQVARHGDVAAIIALGAVIRGATPHFDHVAAQAAKGISQVSLDTGIPIAFGVLTTDTIEQAVERAGTKAGNKGYDAAMVAIEMVALARVLRG
ncbi:MAG TPA: 6,7-dimethyl-8-ribityllumazine synthase [Polyangiaceae bacterium]|nr:6,7-dimethyl-8-ribityllumazine synthase [Polyangiaceae bacterium]